MVLFDNRVRPFNNEFMHVWTVHICPTRWHVVHLRILPDTFARFISRIPPQLQHPTKLYAVCCDIFRTQNYTHLASADPTVPTASPMRLPITNPNPNTKTHPNPNPIFNLNPNPCFGKKTKKQHRNIGQNRVIFTGYLQRDGMGLIDAHKRKIRSFFFYFGSALARRSRQNWQRYRLVTLLPAELNHCLCFQFPVFCL